MAHIVSGENEEERSESGRNGVEGSASAGPPPGQPNMGSPVTPHVGITGIEDFKILSCGIDSLYLAGYVEWGKSWLSLLRKLEVGKRKAQELNTPVMLQDTCAGPCLITPKGKPPMYAFHLKLQDFHLYVGKNERGDKAANAYVSFNSKSIWRRGVSELVSFVEQLISELDGFVRQFKPSRVDLCADFLVPGGVPLSVLRCLGVPEDFMTCDIMKGSKLETYYIGAPSSSIRARIYDKAKEVLVSHKQWFKDIWQIEVLEDIWRVEYQLRRAAIKAYGIDTVPALLNALGGIWHDLTHDWYSLRLQDDSNTSRRTVHPFWQAVQKCAPQFGEVIDIKRDLTPSGKATKDFYSSRAANLLVGYAACIGVTDIHDALDEFMQDIGCRWGGNEFYEAVIAKMVSLNIDEPEEVEEDDIPF